MAKSKALFDPGKILLWAEKGLEFLFIKMENMTEKKLSRSKNELKRSKRHYNVHIDYDNTRLEKEVQKEKEIQVVERMQEINDLQNDPSQDIDLDKD